jgi:putative hydrolase of the HAD superfamily
MAKPRALVFDLAGVLLDFGGIESVEELSGGRVGAEDFSRFWSCSPWADGLYRGTCAPQEFAAGAVAEWSLSATPAAFLTAFQAWLRGPYPGAFELLQELRPKYRLACLSNTNVLDVSRFRMELHLHERFDECFFSNEIGLRKPDSDCYRHVLRRLDMAPQDVAFFDDSPACVAGALFVGMSAHHCTGLESLRCTLNQLEILDRSRHGA